mmetsp:Transcript_21443/g.66887  ORF Transcript_21443/g.66887 Transcript_21443/m.66887 type:complete len:90 (-) Transcript_21443:83-352(-)
MSCSISTGTDAPAEIRTKVFRAGAPLLRSTIPLSLGTPRPESAGQRAEMAELARAAAEEDDGEMETIISVSDGDFEDAGMLSVTLDFPC